MNMSYTVLIICRSRNFIFRDGEDLFFQNFRDHVYALSRVGDTHLVYTCACGPARRCEAKYPQHLLAVLGMMDIMSIPSEQGVLLRLCIGVDDALYLTAVDR